MVSWLPVWEGESLCRYGGGAGSKCRARRAGYWMSGMQPLVEGDICRGRGWVKEDKGDLLQYGPVEEAIYHVTLTLILTNR